MKQTAVEWLKDKISEGLADIETIQQAEEMEKEQIIDAYRNGKIEQLENSEQYYNKTFKSE